MRHQAGVVDNHVNPPVRGNRRVNEAFDLLAVGDVGLNGCARAKFQFFDNRLEAIEPARTEDKLRTLTRKMTCRRLTEPTARTSDDDDLAFNIL
jgi:hypothetical protein